LTNLVAIVLGSFVGLFLGEPAGKLEIVGTIWVTLLQMTVLPYVLFSVIAAVGKLSLENAKQLAKIGGGLVVGSWIPCLALVSVTPLAFPEWQSATFFSTAMLQNPAELDLVSLYFTSNPFHAMAYGIVPAVVLFALAVGTAIIGIEGKESLFDVLDIVTRALTSVAGVIGRFTPIGLFAIIASASGTMSSEEISRLQVYFILYINASIALIFWILPALLSSLTPIPYRSLFYTTGNALMTGFSTGSLLIIIPMMTEGCKKILRDNDLGGEDSDSAVDVLIPVALNVPLAGKLVTLIFMPFAAWFVGTPMELSQYPSFLLAGVASYFGSVNAAVPFLLDMLRIPADMFELFLVTFGVVSSRVSTLLTALNMMVIGILGACLLTGRLQIPTKRVVTYCAVSLVAIVSVTGVSRAIFSWTFTTEYEKDQLVSEMRIAGAPTPSTVLARPDDGWDWDLTAHHETPDIDAIRARGRVRVGFVPRNMPYAYENRFGELVGLDIELIHALATALEVEITFVPLSWQELGAALHSGFVDLTAAGLPMSILNSHDMQLSRPYLDTTLALIVKDHLRDRFRTLGDLRETRGVRIAVIANHFFREPFERFFPNVEVREIASTPEYFEERSGEFDALLFGAEPGSTWTLLYPNFSVVVPRPATTKMPIAFGLHPDNDELRAFTDSWIELASGMGVIKRAYRHWFMGEKAREPEPRWSIIKDVLHWTDG